ncbi:MAG: spermidine/putrescine ABC transporter substrate-binding protein [Chlamydiales bacterium]|nr:spermidine/putrescine ABC transporter substrate-binding protein [Chlamydiales bacterium]
MKRLIIVCWIFVFFAALYLPKTSFIKDDGKTLHVFTWPDFFDVNKIREFEKETGIKVKLSYFTSNEELLIKLKTNSNNHYDLITPSDYAVKILIDQGAISPIDKTKINGLEHIYPFVLNKSHDPGNRYSLPYIWEVYGMGYNKDFFKDVTFDDFSPIFKNEKGDYKITMIPDPFDVFFLASLYLYGSTVECLTKEQLHEVTDLLKHQKQWVEAYVDDRSKYLLATKNCQLGLFKSSYFIQVAASNNDIGFVLPEKTTFITVESFSIPKHCKHPDLVYTFLNYFYIPENAAPHLQRTPLYPVDPRVLPLLNEPDVYFEILNQVQNHEHLVSFKYLVPEQEVRNAWVEIKAH